MTTIRAAAKEICFAMLAVVAIGAGIVQAENQPQDVRWIWSDSVRDQQQLTFRRSVTLPSRPQKAILTAVCDNRMEVLVNGREVLFGDDWNRPVRQEIAAALRGGPNTLVVLAGNSEGPAGLALLLQLEFADGTQMTIVSDENWRVAEGHDRRWRGPRVDESQMAQVRVLGPLGTAPWTAVTLKSFLEARVPKPAQATPAEQITLPEGFRAELLYSVPLESQGSWISLTVDPQGRLITSDQYGKLYRVRVSPAGQSPASADVEALDVDVGTAHGLLYAFDSLYVVAGERNQGLYRVRDTDGDDRYDEVKLLRRLPGGGEHGPHSVVLAPDGKSLFVCAGNHTDLPPIEKSLVPRNWQEDQLLPRMWDAGGHAVGRLAPGGWICRVSPDGSEFELFSIGFRNEFDIAFNAEGELFTYDSDMEWDIGAPWYRPTRVCHVVPGSEFGWRSGTGKWPDFYPDSLPAAVNIGPGSPTGIVFGTGARFPAKYQKALFISDWSYGKLYAVHLTPRGASYTGEFELFATASPLAITDVIIHPQDGAMYFVTGGRRSQSGLYRIRYVGPESTEPVDTTNPQGAEARQLRHQLESLFTREDPEVVDQALPYLGHPDRFLRYAARIALEHQPVERWASRVLQQKQPDALITGAIALARCGTPAHKPALVDALKQLSWSELSLEQRLALLRAYGLVFIRLGEPTPEERATVLAHLDQHYPAATQWENQELCRVLVYLRAPGVVDRTLALLDAATTQEEQVHYVLCLRVLKEGWTLAQRETYFRWFLKAATLRGGHSFEGFLRNIRNEAIENLSEEERKALKPILDMPVVPESPDVALRQRPFVKKWTVQELIPLVENGLSGRDFQRGKQLFAEALCFKCHRFDGQGGIVGPDLTGVGKRFDYRYLLEALIEPSKVISDQYQATVFVLSNGQTVVGKVANLSGDNIMVITNMLEPGKMTAVPRRMIEEQFPSKTSMMPEGLLDNFQQEEILDLLAYLRSGGNPDFEAFHAAGNSK